MKLTNWLLNLCDTGDQHRARKSTRRHAKQPAIDGLLKVELLETRDLLTPTLVAVASDDFGNGPSSACRIQSGQVISGSIETGSDEDWFRLDATVGQTYRIQTSLGSVSDTTLTLYAGDGKTQVGSNDDFGGTLASRLEFKGGPFYTPTGASTGSSCFIRIKAFDALQTGTYTLSVTSTSTALPNLQGQWYMSGSLATSIRQDGGQGLTFINENGNSASGAFVSGSQVIAYGWNGLRGTIRYEADGLKIQWTNGTFWTQAQRTPSLSGTYIVQSNNRSATISQNGNSLTLIDEYGNCTVTQLIGNQFTAWGQKVTVTQNGFLTQILWDGNSWNRSQLAGTYYVHSNGRPATISQNGNSLKLTNEYGSATSAQLVGNQFTAWGQTATVIQNGFLTQILWSGNSWDRALSSGTYFVRSTNSPSHVTTISQNGDYLTLTDEYGNSTTTAMQNVNQFQAWGQTASIIQNGSTTQIQWNGNSWDRTQVAGTYIVHSNSRIATIAQYGNCVTLTDENRNSTNTYFVDPTHFDAWGQRVTVAQSNGQSQLLWTGNSWDPVVSTRDISGNWNYNGTCAVQVVNGNLVFINERGERSNGKWIGPSQVIATDWGNLVGNVVQFYGRSYIQWSNNTTWSRIYRVMINVYN